MKTLILLAVSAFALALPSHAQDRAPLRNLSADGLALGGFDPVAYFPAGGAAAAAGTAQFEAKSATARIRFVSAEHLAEALQFRMV